MAVFGEAQVIMEKTMVLGGEEEEEKNRSIVSQFIHRLIFTDITFLYITGNNINRCVISGHVNKTTRKFKVEK